MLDHHIQRSIVHALAFSEAMRFGELKPDDIDNKLFTYHLKKVIHAGLVEKTEDGLYMLTSEGRRVGKSALQPKRRSIDRAYSIVLLAIRRKEDGAWLLVQRKSHPLLGMKGFMQVRPEAARTVNEIAADACANIGLTADFSVHGHGYFTIHKDGVPESFIHFTLLTCTAAQGVLRQSSELMEYYWDAHPDFAASDMLPNMQTLHKMLQAQPGGFVEQVFDIA